MSVELALLKSLSNKSNLENYSYLVNPRLLAQESQVLLNDYKQYFNEFNSEEVNFSDFRVYFFTNLHPYLSEKEQLGFKSIFDSLVELEVTQPVQTILKGFEQQEFYNELQSLLNQNVDTLTLLDKITDFNSKIEIKGQKTIQKNFDLKEALEKTDRTQGLRFRCKSLASHFNGGLIPGDLIVIASPPDGGKSSFLASELSFMGEQVTGDDKILWLVNEDSPSMYGHRLYQAAFNCTYQELTKFTDKAIRKYKEKMNGDSDRIIIQDIAGWNTKDIQQVIASVKPRLVAIDMLDNVSGFEKYQKRDEIGERYCKLYQWARELSVQYCPFLITTQTNRTAIEGYGDAEYRTEVQKYPPLTALRQSGIDKQAAAKVVLFIGMLPGQQGIRYLSTPKFKLEGSKSWRSQVKFDESRCRFE